VEAEGVFNVVMFLDSRTKSKDPIKRFRMSFAVPMKNEDKLMVQLYNYFKCGNLSKNKQGMTVFTVQDISSIFNIIIPHFLKYPLQGTKHLDFLDFYKVAEIVQGKKHLTEDGFKEIMSLYLQMNTKRYNNLNTLSIAEWREKDFSYLILNGHYINGFIAGDGSIGLTTNLDNMKKFGTILISVSQHINNYVLIASILRYFSPNVNPSKHSEFSVGGILSGIKNWDQYLAPHFLQFPMHGHKQIAISKLFEVRTLLDDKNNKKTQEKIITIWNDFNKNFYN